MKKVSDKRARQLREYHKRRKIFLEENPICVVTGQMATEVHHAAGRIGEMLLDENYWIPVSREGHLTIEYNPLWAKEKGFSVSRLSIKA